MKTEMTPFLLFDGKAQEAMRFYVSIFPNSKITQILFDQTDGTGKKDSIEKAYFSLNGNNFMCGDHPLGVNNDSKSVFFIHIDCANKKQLYDFFEALSVGGNILHTINRANQQEYSGKVKDKFGVIWQLTGPKKKSGFIESNVCYANSQEVRPEYRE